VFIEEYLQDLRRDRFAPRAILTYALQVGRTVRSHLDANPGAVRSVWSVALVFFAATFVAAAALALAHDRALAIDYFLFTSLGILPAFGFVTLHLGLLRDRDGYRLSALNLPTVITLLRVVLVPGIALFLVERHFALAFCAFLGAALSDVADGWLARRWNQITRLGTVLDPLVDIVFNLAIFGALAGAELVPRWVFGVAALRYGILLVGAACFYVFVGPVRIQPTLFGRLTGVVMSALVALLVLLRSVNGALAERLGPLTEMALGVLLSATVVQVLLLGWYNLRVMRGKTEAQGRVVGDVRWGAP
jgi:cardiolipin synthase